MATSACLQNGSKATMLALCATMSLACTASDLKAFNIELDFSHDSGGDNFFATNTAAKSAVEQAAQDIGNLITTALAPVKESYSGEDGFTTVAFNWEYLYTNPDDGTEESIPSPSIAANTVKIYVGVRELAGDTLGSGGPGGVQLGISASNISPTYLQNALDQAAYNSNNGIGRGAGPVIQNITGTASFSGTPGSYDLDVGVGIGNLWFDVDTDNKKGKDDDATLESFWHFDHTTPVTAGKVDFYSVALHELLHAVGFGVSATWDDQLSGSSDWTGSEVISLTGSGTGLIDATSGHIADGITSNRLSDGVSQTAVMGPIINQGERRLLTELDAAFLRDLGYTTIPEPSTLMLLAFALSPLVFIRTKCC
ncbi:MAG: hypothetical protein KJO79_05795 [Verrucomicrobiae bacterium]|nr:hypothetical protein [Verrucomicrobiae bacterium]NNJ86676.1 hypothetical protein [Akkermansiaceae bacterium]